MLGMALKVFAGTVSASSARPAFNSTAARFCRAGACESGNHGAGGEHPVV